jgi:hypothetical protein
LVQQGPKVQLVQLVQVLLEHRAVLVQQVLQVPLVLQVLPEVVLQVLLEHKVLLEKLDQTEQQGLVHKPMRQVNKV